MNLKIPSKRILLFILAVIIQILSLLLMATDPAESGFGVQTLWIAPPLFFLGLLLPVVGLLKGNWLANTYGWIRNEPLKSAGVMVVFVIAFLTYGLTLEPTSSLWDCAETIAAAYKLQVPHTPGIPLTLLIGRLFSMLALGDVTQVAWHVNLMSAFFSSLTIGLVFLLIWSLGSKISKSKWVLLVGSMGGALCLTFSDTYWFSAVEAETYGPSGFFMVLLIWLSMQGRTFTGQDRNARVLLIAYLAGLSFCIHPMCILILPVCFMIWQKDLYDQKWKLILFSGGLGIIVILLINRVIAVDFFEWAFRLDLFLVNRWSLPFYSGAVVLTLILSLVWVNTWMKLKRSRLLLLTFLMIILGFTPPYLMLFVRSAKLPPINEFSPHNLAKIKPYMNRESYPGRPLLFGPYFDARVTDVSKKASAYVVEGDRYQKVGEISKYHYEDHRMTWLPRIYSDDPAHIETYCEWTGLGVNENPGFSDNLKFMLRYQLGHMYIRYLMWNFSGRANDIQHATWLWPWDGAADRSAIDYNRANNQYFFLPLLLGLMGMFWQMKKDDKNFIINLSFFLITGLLLAVYLNATPNEPRERDYIYVGSYMAFTVWIGLGMMGIMQCFRSTWRVVPILFFLGVTVWMFYQNLDDHDRSGRTFQIDHARNLLGSCEKNAILFTGGDNDTFPLWYLQEVEGFRTDVRVKVLSYFNADWYINQLTRSYYDSPPLKLSLSANNQYGPYHPIYIRETMDSSISWGKYMQALINQNPQLKVKTLSGDEAYYLPSRKISLKTGKGKLDITVSGSYLQKNELAILDLIYSNGWKRPVYFNFTALHSLNIELSPYLIQKGLVYKLTPEVTIEEEIRFNLEATYRHLIQNADYSNLGDSTVYFNHEDYQSRMILPLKFNVNSLIEEFIEAGNMIRAEEVTLFAYESLYHKHLEPSYADLQMGNFLKMFDRPHEAQKLVLRLFEFTYEEITFAIEMDRDPQRNDWLILQEAAMFLEDPSIAPRYDQLIKSLR